jgi:hypothetical protein
VIRGVSQTGETHLLEHPPHALAEFRAETEVGADASGSRVASEPSDAQWISSFG